MAIAAVVVAMPCGMSVGVLSFGERGGFVRVRFDEVSFSYRGRRALRDVTWGFGGGVTGLLGPNGAGKTTLLSLVVTLLRADSGRVYVGDHDLSTGAGRRQARRLLGFVPQRFSLAPEMRVGDTVTYAAWVHGVAERDCPQAAVRALEEVGLIDRREDPVRALSGGQRQRLGLAAALAHDPAVVVLDEPTVGLDPGQRLRLRERVAAVGERRTVLLASHLLEDIEHLCDRVGVLAGGAVVFDGTVAELSGLIDGAAVPEAAPGSRFERAYDALIAKLGEA
ncbi:MULTISPECIES: ATP-binding cassette domain-containing protein [Pseudonocardiaceae]|uniref:ATP-binding cassette domain-containing protein n=1 Tax=Pseudonocardiaceae TaxID=2070 RepID=UPI001E3CAF04|nr:MULTISPECIES: ATP-binding cassette domain-containing protein [Pseudonocardiaceae]